MALRAGRDQDLAFNPKAGAGSKCWKQVLEAGVGSRCWKQVLVQESEANEVRRSAFLVRRQICSAQLRDPDSTELDSDPNMIKQEY